MKLLSALPRANALIPSAERGLSLFLVAFVLGLELAGRQAAADYQDAVAGAAVLSVGIFVLAWHRRYPLPWLGWANRTAVALAERAGKLKYEVGLDFRGSPPLPHRLPRVVPAVVAGLLAWIGVAVAAWWAFPSGWREAGLRSSYVLYLLVLIATWGMLLAAGVAGVYLPVWAVDQRLKAGKPADAGGADPVALLGYGVLAGLVAWVTPPVYAVGLSLTIAVISLAAVVFASGNGVAFVWRAGPGSDLAAVPLPRLVATGVGILALGVFALLVTAAGGHLTATPLRDDPNPMLVTAFLGSWAAWLVPGVVAVLGYHLYEWWQTDPAGAAPATVHVAVGPFAADRWRATAELHRLGWKVALAPTSRTADMVGVKLVPQPESEATAFDPGWPLRVGLDDLGDEAVQDRLTRRDEIQLRRQFFAGLTKLWKQVKAGTPEPGGGHWLAPHWWFIDNVQWERPARGADPDGEPVRPVGPGFAATFPPRVRQHLHKVLRAAEVDLIYIEHGVGPRSLERSLRTVFEVYDKSNGQKRAEDHHFAGGTKVRAMLHEYSPGNKYQPPDGYPEPGFDDVSRFRVLHLFKDRGGLTEDVSPPFDFSYEPSPLVYA